MYASHAISDILEIFESIAADIEQKNHRIAELDQSQTKLQRSTRGCRASWIRDSCA